jgi:hypothetical protein
MKYETWRTWIEFIGIAALIISLLFLGYELQLSREISRADRLVASGEVEIAIRGLIAENAHIWRVGCLGEELTDEERIVFQNLVFAVSFKAFTRWNGARTSVGVVDPGIFAGFVGNSVHAFPGFAKAHDALDFPKDWKDAVNKAVQRAQKLEPHRTADIATCGLF